MGPILKSLVISVLWMCLELDFGKGIRALIRCFKFLVMQS